MPNNQVKIHSIRRKRRSVLLWYRDPDTGEKVQINTHTRDEAEVEQQRAKLEAQLLLGMKPLSGNRAIRVGPQMLWDDFREAYYELQLSTLKSAGHAESRLDIAERILKPRRLADVANFNALTRLRNKLLDGAASRTGRPRSPHTVKSHLTAVMTALNWAHHHGWVDTVPKKPTVRTSKLKAMKGRPITAEEFERMLAKVPKVVGQQAAPSWIYTLRGLWESSLRLDELLHVAWDKPGNILPLWRPGRLPVLLIPASMQKNDTEEEIPLLPGFEAVLLETPPPERTGCVFNPARVRPKRGR